jgi:uracil phosphoribosyltransferase
MKNLTIIDHPLIKRDLSILRDKKTNNHLFRTTLRRISSVMAFEVTRDLRLNHGVVRTPLETTRGYALADEIVIVPVLRAGLGLVEGFLDFLPEARVGHVGIYRNEKTLEPVDYYSKFPRVLNKGIVMLLDPMLATGGSGAAAISFLKQKGARRIRFVSLLAAPEGVRKITRAHPDVHIFSTVLDRQLNSRGFILPGLGDAGDRIFGTE